MKFKERRKKYAHKLLLLENKSASISRNTWAEKKGVCRKKKSNTKEEWSS